MKEFQPVMVQIVDGGLAVDVFPGSDMMSNIRTWKFGVQAELNLDSGEEPHISIRPAREGEMALKMRHSPVGPFFRIPTPPGLTIAEQCKGVM
jgi:hypothetical protein